MSHAPFRRRLSSGAAATSLTIAVLGCATPAPTPPATRLAQPAPTPSLTSSALSTPAAIRTPPPTLAPLSLADLGPGDWELIATATNERGAGRTEIVGTVRHGFAWAMTCSGDGDAVLSLGASGPGVPAPLATPTELVDVTLRCPTTQVGLDDGSEIVGEAVSISPNVDPMPGVVYRLIVGTRRF